MFTLPNPRHESFALALAQGATPEAAYCIAGFSDKNRKARSQDLFQDPDIAERAAYLKTCLPRIDDLRDRFAPSVLLMPETPDQMKAWLWQVANGTRKILPLQLRAVALLCRLNGWHVATNPKAQLDPSVPSSPSGSLPQAPCLPPTDRERHLLATFSQHTVAMDRTLSPVKPDDAQAFYSAMADTALVEKVKWATPQSSSVAPQLTPSPAPQSSPEVASPSAASPNSPVAPQLVPSPPTASSPLTKTTANDHQPLPTTANRNPAPESPSPNGDKMKSRVLKAHPTYRSETPSRKLAAKVG